MKLRYLFTAFISALLFAGCSEDNEPAGTLGGINLSTTYATISDDGGSTTVTINTSNDWKITTVAVDPETGKQVVAENGEPVRDKNGKTTDTWFTTSQLSGEAGETEITFTAGATESGREYEVRIDVGGSTQFLVVRQGSYDVQTATCEEVINGVDGKTYRVKGTVTAIANTTYGNWYLNDGTGEVYIYGTLDADGGTQNFASLGIEVGDVVEVEGPRQLYGSTTELVDVTVVSITKSLLKVVSEEVILPKEGGELEVKAAFKGNGTYVDIPEELQSWISYKSMEYIAGVPTKIETSPADTAVFKFNILPNEVGARTATLEFKSSKGSNTSTVEYTFTQEGSILEVSIADFNAAEKGETLYRLSGVVTKISDGSKGQFYIKDYSGETYIYNIADFASQGINVGDIVTVVGKRDEYKTTIEMTSGEIEKVVPVTEVSIADFLTKGDSRDTYYMVTGTISRLDLDNDGNCVYGNLYITDGTDELYVYGCYPGYGATGDARKNFLTAAGIEVGDKLTMIGYKATYNGIIELCGGIYYSHEKPE